jgi:hypothetical protein
MATQKTQKMSTHILTQMLNKGTAPYRRGDFKPERTRNHVSALASRLKTAGLIKVHKVETEIYHFGRHDILRNVAVFVNTLEWLQAPDPLKLAHQRLSEVGDADREARVKRVAEAQEQLAEWVPKKFRTLLAVLHTHSRTSISSLCSRYGLNLPAVQSAVNRLVEHRLVYVSPSGRVMKTGNWGLQLASQVLVEVSPSGPVNGSNGHAVTVATVKPVGLEQLKAQNDLMERTLKLRTENEALEQKLLEQEEQRERQRNLELRRKLGMPVRTPVRVGEGELQ